MIAVIPFSDQYHTLCAINDALSAWQDARDQGRNADAQRLSDEHDRIYDAYMRALFTPLPPLERRRFIPKPVIVPPLNESAPLWHERMQAREKRAAALAAIQFGFCVEIKP